MIAVITLEVSDEVEIHLSVQRGEEDWESDQKNGGKQLRKTSIKASWKCRPQIDKRIMEWNNILITKPFLEEKQIVHE